MEWWKTTALPRFLPINHSGSRVRMEHESLKWSHRRECSSALWVGGLSVLFFFPPKWWASRHGWVSSSLKCVWMEIFLMCSAILGVFIYLFICFLFQWEVGSFVRAWRHTVIASALPKVFKIEENLILVIWNGSRWAVSLFFALAPL